MTHNEFQTAAATLNAELTATRNGFNLFGALIAGLKNRIATRLIAREPFSQRGGADTPDILDDLNYPNLAVVRH